VIFPKRVWLAAVVTVLVILGCSRSVASGLFGDEPSRAQVIAVAGALMGGIGIVSLGARLSWTWSM
jgi:hypothetical protein